MACVTVNVAVDDCVRLIGVGSVAMWQVRGQLCEPGSLGFFLQHLSARVSRDAGNNVFHAGEVGIQVFCFLFGVKSKEIELKQTKLIRYYFFWTGGIFLDNSKAICSCFCVSCEGF